MDHVKASCANDVNKLCSGRPQPSAEEFGSPMVMLHPMRISSVLDDMMNTALSNEDRAPMTITFFSSDKSFSPDIVFDGMLSSLFSQVQSAPKPPMSVHELTKKVVERGHEILAKEQDEGRRRLARRLAEVDPKRMTTKANLPYRCKYQNACLHAAYEQGVVSSQCARSIQYLEEIPQYSVRANAFADRYRRAMLPMLWVYALLCLATLLAIRRRYRKQWLSSDKRQLKMRILQAIYSNPHLKSQLEDALGEPLGAVPPLPRRVLEKMSGGGRRFHLCFAVKVAFLLSLVVLVFVMPCVVLPICIVSVFARLCYIACCMPAIDEGKCVCCCCAGSTEDVQNGTVSAKQACCTCCNGTGVCAVACVSCCGMDGKGCSCCSKGCNCCSDGKGEEDNELKVKLIGQGQKHMFVAKEAEVFCGIPVQVV